MSYVRPKRPPKHLSYREKHAFIKEWNHQQAFQGGQMTMKRFCAARGLNRSTFEKWLANQGEILKVPASTVNKHRVTTRKPRARRPRDSLRQALYEWVDQAEKPLDMHLMRTKVSELWPHWDTVGHPQHKDSSHFAKWCRRFVEAYTKEKNEDEAAAQLRARRIRALEKVYADQAPADESENGGDDQNSQDAQEHRGNGYAEDIQEPWDASDDENEWKPQSVSLQSTTSGHSDSSETESDFTPRATTPRLLPGRRRLAASRNLTSRIDSDETESEPERLAHLPPQTKDADTLADDGVDLSASTPDSHSPHSPHNTNAASPNAPSTATMNGNSHANHDPSNGFKDFDFDAMTTAPIPLVPSTKPEQMTPTATTKPVKTPKPPEPTSLIVISDSDDSSTEIKAEPVSPATLKQLYTHIDENTKGRNITPRLARSSRGTQFYSGVHNSHCGRCTRKSPCVSTRRCDNMATQTECAPNRCSSMDRCMNQKIRKKLYPCTSVIHDPVFTYGLRLDEDVPRDTKIIEYVGQYMTQQEYETRSANMVGSIDWYMAKVSEVGDLYVDAGRLGNQARFINHSCLPNCRFETWYVDTKPRLMVVSNYPLSRGTVLSISYMEPKWNIPCLCGACNGNYSTAIELLGDSD